MSTRERRIRALKEMARTLRVGGRIMIYVWAMEQKRRKFEKQDIFVPWNPNPPLSPRGPARRRRRGNGTQSVSEAPHDSGEKHRNVRSTSSVVEEEEDPVQQRKQKLWFFSRSLDSVLDFSSLSISRSSSRDLSAFCSSTGETRGESETGDGTRLSRGRGLIRQVSSFFCPSSSRTSLEEDVFVSDPQEQLHTAETDETGTGNETVSIALVQDGSTVALPDLVSCQREQGDSEGLQDETGDGGELGQDGRERQDSPVSVQQNEEEWSKEKLKESCLRYYHVFREGELTQLIEDHVEELQVLHTCLDHANWCVVAEKVHVWRV